MKLGLFSGTFDPIHNGHIALAKEIIKRKICDLVYILPERRPRYKPNVSMYEKRLAMALLATKHNPYLLVPTQKLKLIKGDYHTASEIIPIFKKNNAVDLKLILGNDVFGNIHKWRDINSLAKQIAFIVAVDDYEKTKINNIDTKLRVKFVPKVYPDVSSTKVREQIKQDAACKYVAKEVGGYIKNNKLYI